jgi:signal peptidase I
MTLRKRVGRIAAAGLGLMCLVLVLRMRFSLELVSGESMMPTFHTGDLMLVDRLAYEGRDPQRSDVVIAAVQRESIVKRIVGLPGEYVELKKGKLYINDAPIEESHPVRKGPLDIAQGRLFAGKFATLGDNRKVSASMAVHPILTKEQIIGKVILNMSLFWKLSKASRSAGAEE